MLTRVVFAAALILGIAGACQAQETAIVALGLADHKVSEDELAKGETLAAPKFNTPGVAYVVVANAKKGDAIEVTLMKDGDPLMRNMRDVDADAKIVLLQAGKTGVPAGGWPGGSYAASAKVTRDGKAIAEQQSDPIPFD